jgi:hypothetical protein
LVSRDRTLAWIDQENAGSLLSPRAQQARNKSIRRPVKDVPIHAPSIRETQFEIFRIGSPGDINKTT